MSLPAPFSITPPSSLPDREALLLASVRQRDSAGTARLLQQWVHRQGIEALNTFSSITLSIYEGPEASTWLQEQINAPDFSSEPAPNPQAMESEPESEPELDMELEPQPKLEPEPVVQPDPVIETSLSPVAEADAGSERPETDGDLAGEQPITVSESDMELPQLGSLLDIDPWAPQAGSAQVPAVEPLTEPLTAPEIEEELPPTPANEGERAGVLARGSRSLSRMRSLMRGCLDGALDAVRAEPAPIEAGASSDPVGSTDGGGQVPEALWTRSGDELDQPEDGAPRIGLTRLSFEQPFPDAAAAPSPQALNDLRSWLPDEAGEDDLPRAC